MFDRGKPSEAADPSTSPDRKKAPTQGSYMNNEQFCLSFPNLNLDAINASFPVHHANPLCPTRQLHTSEIFATTEEIGLVVRGPNLSPPLPSPATARFASPLMAALHWVTLAALPSARPLARP